MAKSHGFLIRLPLVLLALSGLLASGCAGDAASRLSATGRLEEAGITTFQYGTHLLVSDDGTALLWALRSGGPDLDEWIGRMVTITGTEVPGYPVENGPPYMEVTGIGPAP